MNINLIIQGKIELILGILSGILIYFASLKAFSFFTKGLDEEKEFKANNAAVSILISAFVFGIMILIKESISPSMENLGYTLAGKLTLSSLGLAVLRIVIIYFISALAGFIFLFISIKFFMMLTTQIDEIKEIKKNNIAVAIVIGVLTISVAMIALHPLQTLLKSFISAPVVMGDYKEPLINNAYLTQGLIEIFISLIAAVLIFLFAFKAYDFMTKNIDETKELKGNNIAVAIQVSAFIFSIMLIVKASLLPSFDVLQKVLQNKADAILILFAALKIGLFFILAGIIAFFILWLVLIGFMFLNKNIDNMKELKNKNIAVAIAIAVLLISAALLVEHGVVTLISAFV